MLSETRYISSGDEVMPTDATTLQMVIGVTLAVATWIATFVNLRMKAEVQQIKGEFERSNGVLKIEFEKSNNALEQRIADKLDKFQAGFLPFGIANEQKASTEFRITNLEKELKDMRERRHTESQELTKMFMTEFRSVVEEVFKMNEILRDKARRLSSVEAKVQANEERLHDHAQRIHELERGHK